MTLHGMGKTTEALVLAENARRNAGHAIEHAAKWISRQDGFSQGEESSRPRGQYLENAARWPGTGHNGRIELAAVLVLLGRPHEALATIGMPDGEKSDLGQSREPDGKTRSRGIRQEDQGKAHRAPTREGFAGKVYGQRLTGCRPRFYGGTSNQKDSGMGEHESVLATVPVSVRRRDYRANAARDQEPEGSAPLYA